MVYEEVGVGKREVQDSQQVSGTVRREEARIENEGDVPISGGGGTWSQAMPGYRQRWQARYGTSGDRWEDAEPGYRYGYDMRQQPQYRGRAWNDVEPEFSATGPGAIQALRGSEPRSRCARPGKTRPIARPQWTSPRASAALGHARAQLGCAPPALGYVWMLSVVQPNRSRWHGSFRPTGASQLELMEGQ